MTPILSKFRIAGRALIVAAVLGAGGLAAAPAVAQDASFSFSLGIGGNGQPSFGFGIDSDGDRFDRPSRNICLTDRQLLRGLRDQGYSRVEIIQSSRRHAEAFARYGRSTYHLDINKCTGEIDAERVRRNRGNGFGLQFNFGS